MEETLPPQTEQGAGFERTTVRQFTVFLENRVGKLQALVRAYEATAGRIVALSIHNSADTALARLIYSDPELARETLQQQKFAFAEQEVLAVQLPKRTKHPLMTICGALLAAELNIDYAYPLLFSPDGPTVCLHVDDPVLAAQVLIRKGFTLVGESDLKKLE